MRFLRELLWCVVFVLISFLVQGSSSLVDLSDYDDDLRVPAVTTGRIFLRPWRRREVVLKPYHSSVEGARARVFLEPRRVVLAPRRGARVRFVLEPRRPRRAILVSEHSLRVMEQSSRYVSVFQQMNL